MSKLGLRAGRPSERGGATKATLLADLADKPIKPIRINFDLSREQHQRLKLLALMQGKTVTDILRDLIAQELNAQESV